MTNIIGKVFYFRGDWQTEPGKWRVMEERHDPHTYYCEPADRNNHGASEFWDQVVEDCLKRGEA